MNPIPFFAWTPRPAVSHGKRFGALDKPIQDAVTRGTLPDSFVPTPPKVIDLMMKKADFRAGQLILEPSAGQGHLAEAARKATYYMEPAGQVDVVELNPLLSKALELRNFHVVGDNIMTYRPGPLYDRIIMNPPYSNGNDVTHTIHCFNNLLAPGGKLVAVLPEAAFDLSTGPGKKIMTNPITGLRYNQELANLLKQPDVEAEVIRLPDNAFDESDVPRQVKTRLVVLTKKA